MTILRLTAIVVLFAAAVSLPITQKNIEGLRLTEVAGVNFNATRFGIKPHALDRNISPSLLKRGISSRPGVFSSFASPESGEGRRNKSCATDQCRPQYHNGLIARVPCGSFGCVRGPSLLQKIGLGLSMGLCFVVAVGGFIRGIPFGPNPPQLRWIALGAAGTIGWVGLFALNLHWGLSL